MTGFLTAIAAVACIGLATPAEAATEHWLMTLSMEDLSNVLIAPRPPVSRRHGDAVTAIRAGCADGNDVCAVLREVLASSKPNRARPDAGTATARREPVALRVSAAADRPRPSPDPSMLAGPGHAGYGGAETVDAAVRALGFGLR